MIEIAQVVGSLVILLAFVLALAGRLGQQTYTYLVLNACGSAVLTATAVVERQWGFILLEAVWALVSFATIARRMTASGDAPERETGK